MQRQRREPRGFQSRGGLPGELLNVRPMQTEKIHVALC
jgi:hypothetical protein